jgi:sterol desaturase/sphingolipid hydroxylase (fatty acid hydroxylase superfamily)
MIPFIIAEQLRPVAPAPRLRDYWINFLISLSTAYLSLPLGISAALLSGKFRHLLPWKPLSMSFNSVAAVPVVGPGLKLVAMIFVPLFIHDCWFYWSHRTEHRLPLLWQFHKLHHSDELMNTTTWARDHFLQNSWRAFFSLFTLGLFVDLELADAGKAALYSTIFLVALSLFYHSAIRVHLPWLDYLLVTLQVHRIHHSALPEHRDKNFADALPIFDIPSCVPNTENSLPLDWVRNRFLLARSLRLNSAPSWLSAVCCVLSGTARLGHHVRAAKKSYYRVSAFRALGGWRKHSFASQRNNTIQELICNASVSCCKSKKIASMNIGNVTVKSGPKW